MSLTLDRHKLQSGKTLKDSSGNVFKIKKLLGEGRCAVVYEALDVANCRHVALKVYNSGIRYEGALQRELTVLETLESLKERTNTVQWFGHFQTISNHCVILELLENNIRQILYKNNKQGLSLWGIQKFAKDVLGGLKVLHSKELVHADLKPANIHWCPEHKAYKLLDFGLSFHLSEQDIHQVQSLGYQAPEVQRWNQYKLHCKELKTHHLKNSEKSYENSKINNQQSLSRNQENNRKLMRPQQICFVDVSIPPVPNCAIDVWSMGCLLVEVASGGKFLKDDIISSNLNDNEVVVHKLVDELLMKIAKSHGEKNKPADILGSVEVLKDLIHRCLAFKPEFRLSCEEALKHPFLQFPFEPSFLDCILLSMHTDKSIHLSDLVNIRTANGKHC